MTEHLHVPQQRPHFGSAIKECASCGMGGVQLMCEGVPVIWWDNEQTASVMVAKLRTARANAEKARAGKSDCG